MICSECGSYQPDRAKFCGVCGSSLSQEGLVESFLKKEGEGDIVLPRHRSPWFYLILILVVVVALAVLAGAGYLVYRAAWGEGKSEHREGELEDNTLDYANTEIGFSLSYPDNWTLEEGNPVEKELLALKISLSSQKSIELRAYQLDPVVTIGGLEGIKEFISGDADERIRSLGGSPAAKGTSATGGGQAQNLPGDSYAGTTTGQDTTAEGTQEENGSADDIFTSTQVSGLPAFYTEFNANIMGEETRFLLYYVVADDYLLVFQGRSPAGEYKDVRPLLMAIAGSFKWERAEEAPSSEATAINTR